MSHPRLAATVLLSLATLLQARALAAAAAQPLKTHSATFGTVTLYKPAQPEPLSVALFVSGDGGWNLGVVNMARVTVPTPERPGRGHRRAQLPYAAMERSQGILRQPLAIEFELLSHQIQKQIGLKEYHVPVLIGYTAGDGGCLCHSRSGADRHFWFLWERLSMGFCPQQDFGGAAICPAPQMHYSHAKKGALVFEPAPHLQHPWIALQGDEEHLPGACYGALCRCTPAACCCACGAWPRVGHGFAVERNWLPPLLVAYKSIAAQPEPAIRN